MKKLLQLSKALMFIALGVGAAEFVNMYRSGEINRIYNQEHTEAPKAIIKNAGFAGDAISIDETKSNELQKKEIVNESNSSVKSGHSLKEEESKLSLESFSRAAPGRRYAELIIPDSLIVNPAVVISDSSDHKSSVLPDSAIAKHN